MAIAGKIQATEENWLVRQLSIALNENETGVLTSQGEFIRMLRTHYI